jgi:hypothetical protein
MRLQQLLASTATAADLQHRPLIHRQPACRIITLPTAADKHGLPIGKAVFFPVPSDPEGSFASYKPGGRAGEWFMSNTYLTYQQGLAAALPASSTTTAAAAAAAVSMSDVVAESVPQASLVADKKQQLPVTVNGADSTKLATQTSLKDTESSQIDQQAAA